MSHPPPGGCGLKLPISVAVSVLYRSPSTRRVWIEIIISLSFIYSFAVALHPEGVD
jgi:hypothetical protein